MVQIITNQGGGGGGVGAYKYKGSVDYYEDLPTSGMKIGDTYNVVNAFTKDGKDYPAGTNVAWTGTDWDALGGSIDLSDYQKKLVEGTGIDIDSDTNVISVDTTVIAEKSEIPTDNCQLANGCGYTTCTGDAINACVVHLAGGETITGQKTFTQPTKIQSGDATGALIIGANLNTSVVSANNRKMARVGMPSFDNVAPVTIISGDSQNSAVNLVDFGGNPLATGTSAPDFIRFVVAKTHGSTCGDKINMFEVSNYEGADVNYLQHKKGISLNAKTMLSDDAIPTAGDCSCLVPSTSWVQGELGSYAKTNSLCPVATTGKYCDLSGRPTIPTDNSQLANGCGFTTCTGTLVSSDLTPYAKSCDLAAVATSGEYCDLTGTPDLSGYQTKDCMVCSLSGADDSHYPSAKTVADALSCAGAGDMLKSVYDPNNCSTDAFNYNNMYNKPTIPSVVDSLCCSSATDALSAKQGCILNSRLDTVEARGRFLSNWNATTGLPVSFPEAIPYAYSTGDYYDVTVVGATNYKPTGSSYTGTASTTVETGDLEIGDTYVYDGTNWLLQQNHNITTSFSSISGSPYDNSCLASALGDKANTSSLCAVATSGKYCDLTGTPTIPAAQVQSDWSQSCNACCDYIKNKPSLCTVATSGKYCDLSGTPSLCAVATSGKYCDLTGTPTIPTDNSQLANGCGFTTCTGTLTSSDLTPYAKSCDLCNVATSGLYCDLSGTPTIPTDNCQLSNGCGYTTCTGTLSSCSDVITALGYTPYNSTNPAGYTTCTGTLTSETVVSGDSGTTYTIKKSTTAPTSASNTTITFVVE